jgi:uncharacterized protein (UPF0261 family)
MKSLLKTILVVGTYDTKEEELSYLCECIKKQGGGIVTMDVSVLGESGISTDVSKHQIAEMAESSIDLVINSGNENSAMQIMGRGAALKALALYQDGKIDGVIVLGGTMGTDLALDICCVLPLGVPKYVVSTVSFSAMLPPERLAPDIQMILWAGGLYGLNSVCKSSLSQAGGAVLGAAKAVETPKRVKPLVGMTSFGKTILHYMVTLKPEIELRGFELAVFHATGMGGRAFEALASEGAFACVMDFATQEVGNHIMGSGISAGPTRLTGAGMNGVPQIVAPACYDLVDLIGWHEIPERFVSHPKHEHNRLVTSIVLNTQERREVARELCSKLSNARGPVEFLLPNGGCNEWDRPGEPLHDKNGLEAFCEEMRICCPKNVNLREVDSHINDDQFSSMVLKIFDEWIATGVVG